MNDNRFPVKMPDGRIFMAFQGSRSIRYYERVAFPFVELSGGVIQLPRIRELEIRREFDGDEFRYYAVERQ